MGFSDLAHQRQAEAMPFHILLTRGPLEAAGVRLDDAGIHGKTTERTFGVSFHTPKSAAASTPDIDSCLIRAYLLDKSSPGANC